MGTILLLYIISFVVSVVVSPFIAKSSNPGFILVCMVLCCLLTPFVGYPIYLKWLGE